MPDGGNVKYLLHTPVRLRHDPDVVWRLENRRQDFFDMNEPYASAMVNWLLLNGNDRAGFIVASRPAMVSNGNRNTHGLVGDRRGELCFVDEKVLGHRVNL